jgi:hypothetical protein
MWEFLVGEVAVGDKYFPYNSGLALGIIRLKFSKHTSFVEPRRHIDGAIDRIVT